MPPAAKDAAASTIGSSSTATTATAALAAAWDDGLPPPLKGLELEAHAARAWRFYHDVLGGPKHVMAPMVCGWMSRPLIHKVGRSFTPIPLPALPCPVF
jgi:hypothetical protein